MPAFESDPPSASTRPYLIRALYEWCADNGLTPYIAVRADHTVQVPRDYVHDGQIVLNISADATSALTLDNDYVRFKARFGGVARDIIIPVDRVMAIYARENGQGMAFAEPEAPGGDEAPALNPYAAAAAKSPPEKTPAGSPDGASGGIRLVSTPPSSAPGSDDNDEPPPPPSPRPALKRVK